MIIIIALCILAAAVYWFRDVTLGGPERASVPPRERAHPRPRRPRTGAPVSIAHMGRRTA